MNDAVCVTTMNWFRDRVFFSRDYSDIPCQLLEYSDDKNMLNAISDYAKAADFGIEDMSFEINSEEIEDESVIFQLEQQTIFAKLIAYKNAVEDTDDDHYVDVKDPTGGDVGISDKTPETGDNSHVGLWLSILVVSALGLFFLLFTRRKKEDNK